jgi:hypothetical protein
MLIAGSAPLQWRIFSRLDIARAALECRAPGNEVRS